MLYAQGLLSTLNEHLRVSAIFASVCFQWNKESGQFELKSPVKLVIHKVRMYISWFYTACILLQVAVTWSQTNILVKMHTILFSSAILMNCYCHYTFYSKKTEIVAYLNGMMTFEKHRNGEWVLLLIIITEQGKD